MQLPPSPAAVLSTAIDLLSPRACAGLLARPPGERTAVAQAVTTEAHLDSWERHLSAGQPWPDTIEAGAVS